MAAGCSHALFVEGGGAGVCVWLSSSDYCLQTVVGTVDGIGQTNTLELWWATSIAGEIPLQNLMIKVWGWACAGSGIAL